MSLESEIAEMIIEALNLEDISLDDAEVEVSLLSEDFSLDTITNHSAKAGIPGSAFANQRRCIKSTYKDFRAL